MSGEVA
jgi:hypothetical protein